MNKKPLSVLIPAVVRSKVGAQQTTISDFTGQLSSSCQQQVPKCMQTTKNQDILRDQLS
jgi:hypothetical protein